MSRKSNYVRLGLTIFCSAAAILLFYDMLFGSRVLPGIFGTFFAAVKPILYGAFIAYLLAPALNYLEHLLFSRPLRQARKMGRLSDGGVRAISVLLVWACVAVLVFLLLSVLIPELYKSVIQLANNLENYYNTLYGWVDTLFQRYPEAEIWIRERLKASYNEIVEFVTNSLSKTQSFMAAAGRGVVSVFTFFKDLLIGVIASVSFMSAKEKIAASARRICFALLSPQDAAWTLRAAGKVDGIFSGFVRGKLLDSLIIGVLCFVGCAVLDFPYAPLVSVFVGLTNIIPFFGPFIGAIPSVFLILLVSPMKALYFAIFILILQQVDGNIIGPKILGDQTGLSSLWVIVAILVGGSFFGIPGMFFGVPVFACFYSAGGFFIDLRLRSAGLPSDLREYVPDEEDTKRKRKRLEQKQPEQNQSEQKQEEQKKDNPEQAEGTVPDGKERKTGERQGGGTSAKPENTPAQNLSAQKEGRRVNRRRRKSS